MSAHVFHFPHRIDPARLRPEWVACLIVALAGVVGMDGFRQIQPATALAHRMTLQPIVRAEGDVVAPPELVAYIGASLPAPVQRVRVLLGANVKAGQPLADLVAPDVDRRLATAEVEYQVATQSYNSASSKPDPAVASAREAYALARAEERKARSEVAAWQAQAREINATDSGVVLASNSAPLREPAVDLDRLAYERSVAGQMLWSALQTRDQALAGIRERAEMAKFELVAAKRARKQWQVLAPMTGTVIRMELAPGVRTAGDSQNPAVTIVNLNKLELRADLPSGAEQSIQPGSKAKIVVAGQPGRHYDGVVKTVEDVLASHGNVLKRAVVQIKDNPGYVKPGMKATAMFALPVRKNVVVVPESAVRFADGGRTTVNVITAKGREERAVTIGASDGVNREIAGGLDANEVVELRK